MERDDEVVGAEVDQYVCNGTLDLVLAKVAAWRWGNYTVADASTRETILRIEGKLSLRWTRIFTEPSSGKRLLKIHKKMKLQGVFEAFHDVGGEWKQAFKVERFEASPTGFSLRAFFPPYEACQPNRCPDYTLEFDPDNEDAVCCRRGVDRIVAKARRKPDSSSFVLGCGAHSVTVFPGADYLLVVSLVLIMDELQLEASVGV